MCTGIRLKSKNGAIVYARTLEFGKETDSNIIVIPRNYEYSGTNKQGESKGLQWRSKYAVIGANMLHINDIVDGVNEKGLAGGLFYFPGFAEYQKVSHHEEAHSIAPWELMTWILTNFESVDDVRAVLPTIKVADIVFDLWNIVPPIHAIIHDKKGNSLVIEYRKGELTMHDNQWGVITNAPSFDWHRINLSNYINLTPINVEPIRYNNMILSPLGEGSGMLGLPGDFTPPSRFVRAVAFSQAAMDLSTEDEARKTAFHILNLFTITRGLVREEQGENSYYDYTQWTSASDLKNSRYYWHTYENRQIKMVDLMQMNLNAEKIVTVPMHTEEIILDVSKEKNIF